MIELKCFGVADEVSDDPIGTRAMDEYFENGGTNQPSLPELYDYDGETFVVLSNRDGILAVYLVSEFGELELVENYPDILVKAIEG